MATTHGPVLVVGATGRIGSSLVDELVRAGASVRALVRDRGRASHLPTDVDVAIGDLSRPETLPPAFVDVRRVFIVTSDPRLEPTAVDAARAAGVDLIVKSSAMGPGRRPPTAHATSEHHLHDSGLNWVFLRPNAFMQTLADYLPRLIGDDDTFALPAGSGRTGWVDTRDIAAAATAVLTDPDTATGATYTITGPAALSMHAVANGLAEATGRPIRYQPIDPADAQRTLEVRGLPGGFAQFLTAHYAAVRDGDFDVVTDDLRALTGHPPRSWPTFLQDHPITL